MRVYIAYKYHNVVYKEQLIRDLGDLSYYFTQNDHKPFILGRDLHKWGIRQAGVLKTLYYIVKNIRQSDVLVAYLTTDVKSTGLPTELFFARLFGVPTILCTWEGIDYSKMVKRAYKHIVFTNLHDLKVKLIDVVRAVAKVN